MPMRPDRRRTTAGANLRPRTPPSMLFHAFRVALLVGLIGCALSGPVAGPADVVVAPASTAGRLTFQLFPTSYFYGLAVTTCNGRQEMWVIGTAGDSSAVPASIDYGETPRGFITHAGPRPLESGCYQVIVSGAPPVRFRVLDDGKVVSLADTGASDRD